MLCASHLQVNPEAARPCRHEEGEERRPGAVEALNVHVALHPVCLCVLCVCMRIASAVDRLVDPSRRQWRCSPKLGG